MKPIAISVKHPGFVGFHRSFFEIAPDVPVRSRGGAEAFPPPEHQHMQERDECAFLLSRPALLRWL
jgi:hypothetical protein